MGSTISVVVAEDQDLVLRGIVQILSLYPDITVVGEAKDGQTAVRVVAETEPDVILLDLNMPVLNGLEACRILKKRSPRTGVIALTGYDDEDTIIRILQSGAEGYVMKMSKPDELVHAIKVVRDGGRYYSAIAKKVLGERTPESVQKRHTSLTTNFEKLTSREREILQLVAEGRTHSEIATLLFISIRTVDTHRNNILKKLDLHDTAGLVLFAVKNGIVMINR